MKPISKAIATAAVAVALLAGLLQHFVPTQAEARSCYSIWAQADRMGSRYRHTVYVENDCEYWLQCSLWTNVDLVTPQNAQRRTGDDRARGDQRSSQYDDPRAFGTCHQK